MDASSLRTAASAALTALLGASTNLSATELAAITQSQADIAAEAASNFDVSEIGVEQSVAQTVALKYGLRIAKEFSAITSALTKSGTQNSAISTYTATASNTPTSFVAVGLPAGLSLNASTGAITGTPTVAGTFNVKLYAVNAAGAGPVSTVVFTVASDAPVINSSLTAAGTHSVAFTYTITGTNTPTSFGATGLPAGLSVNTGTGVISGTLGAGTAGVANVTITATNADGTDTKTLVLTVA